jgi:hypothetical protein
MVSYSFKKCFHIHNFIFLLTSLSGMGLSIFLSFIFNSMLLLYWGYIVTFTKVLTMYLSHIPSSSLFPLLPS